MSLVPSGDQAGTIEVVVDVLGVVGVAREPRVEVEALRPVTRHGR